MIGIDPFRHDRLMDPLPGIHPLVPLPGREIRDRGGMTIGHRDLFGTIRMRDPGHPLHGRLDPLGTLAPRDPFRPML